MLTGRCSISSNKRHKISNSNSLQRQQQVSSSPITSTTSMSPQHHPSVATDASPPSPPRDETPKLPDRSTDTSVTEEEESAGGSSPVHSKSSEVSIAKEDATNKRRGSIPSSIGPDAKGGPRKRSRSPIHRRDNTIRFPTDESKLPRPESCSLSPDEYLKQLALELYGIKVRIVPAHELKDDYFCSIKESQVAAYSTQVVSAARANDVAALQQVLTSRGRAALNCFNAFGEGLLNLACRRGYQDLVKFLLNTCELDVCVCDDYGRTPLHDACWHPEPQLVICSWLLDREPSLFLIADKRGYTPFQYARPGDWPVWRNFLWKHRDALDKLCREESMARFCKEES